ncbi:unnamed protein product [Phytomonas sp. EM1]|nr:unnamed protein product [Phytomonas sp. EM1]|eukprot:CCW64333.1 unnamed protein product [Phytomonas sp. isolate EM1]
MNLKRLTAAILKQQDDVCSSAIIQLLENSSDFKNLALREGQAILKRDEEDESKLAKGIELAVRKNILKKKFEDPPAIRINVKNRTAQEITDEIITHLPSREGNVIVVQGLSGTGKGTTVSKLWRALPRCVIWSNGNVFRSYTYLCNEELAKSGKCISDETLTPELLRSLEKRITFEKTESDGQYHTILDGHVRVDDIENTILKMPFIGQNVPTVAQQTQGEVIRFAINALQKLSEEGYNVVVEGRAQTLNFIETKERFELFIPDVPTLGQRRAAQRVMARALDLVGSQIDSLSDKEVCRYVEDALEYLTRCD